MPTALIVDDDPPVQALIAVKLQHEGFTVIQEGDGEAGLAAAIEYRPDVILLDRSMPRAPTTTSSSRSVLASWSAGYRR
jgi:DNA-binding response OmpR family regulator